jgi:ParB-like chromosome segregation protein Spo0J
MQTSYLDPARIQPWHEPDDEDKLTALADSMRTDGWVGAPIVTIAARDYGWGAGNPVAITGSHRIPAAAKAGVEVPAVDLDDLLRAHGSSLAEVDEQTGTNPDDERHEEAVTRLDYFLPADVIEHYGLDAH